MKRTYPSITLALSLVVFLLSATLLTNAQSREKFVISAKAGGVNAVTGRVELKSYSGADWSLLNVTDDLRAGDIVKTGMDGRVEMLLNPGSYLRVAQESEFELTNNSLDNLEVRVVRGTAIIEATGADETELAINITTPHARMVIVKRGLYRVNVTADDTTELFVRKGRVMLADTHTKVKEGNKVIFNGTTFSVAKMEKADKNKDAVEVWSKDRAETVARANNRIRTRDLNDVFAHHRNLSWGGFSSRSGGFWLFNPSYRCYTFMPFYYGWGSPYGGSYSSLFGCSYCSGRHQAFSPGVYTSSNPRSGPGPSSGPGPGSGPGPVSPRVSPRVSPDWPGRTGGKPDTNPDGGRGRPIRN